MISLPNPVRLALVAIVAIYALYWFACQFRYWRGRLNPKPRVFRLRVVRGGFQTERAAGSERPR